MKQIKLERDPTHNDIIGLASENFQVKFIIFKETIEDSKPIAIKSNVHDILHNVFLLRRNNEKGSYYSYLEIPDGNKMDEWFRK